MVVYNVTMTVPYNQRTRPDRGDTILNHVLLEEARDHIASIGLEELPNGTILRITRPTGSGSGSSALYEEYIVQDGFLTQSYDSHKGRLSEVTHIRDSYAIKQNRATIEERTLAKLSKSH